jgi:TolB-like protein/DNA-binding winged helix-turn-helix (wHTH) protein/Flp pilus assembly protein TadD
MSPSQEFHVPDLDRFRVGEWSVRRAENTLCSEGLSIRLEPRVMDVLVYLAARAGVVVSKEELLAAVWGDAFVEEGALSQAIHSLRKVLRDDARQPRFIQTIPKRGYRLVAPVILEVPEAAEESRPSPEPAPAPRPVPLITAPGEPFRQSRRRSQLLLGFIVLAAAAAAWLGWHFRWKVQEPPRIVVLPFENLGRPEDAFFADGLTEEITKDLYSLRSLRVISRTTAMLYAGARKPLPQIGQELGVDYVLEGTVRWARGRDGRLRARITPQLIRVTDDAHVWADAFEREVEDIFEVQKEISGKVIAAMNVTLLPEDAQQSQRPRPKNWDAYRAYLRGLQLRHQPFYSEERMLDAASMFERAVELDPGFTIAWAELSQVYSSLAFNNDGPPDARKHAQQALNQAMALAPELPDVRVAKAHFTYRCLGDFEAALEQLSTAAQLFPNDSGVLLSLGYVLRRKGRLVEAIQMLKNASELEPRLSKPIADIGETYRALRDYELADWYFEQAISLAPDEAYFWQERILNQLAWTGDVKKARAVLEQAPIPKSLRLTAIAFRLDLFERKYERALTRLSAEQVRELPRPEPNRIAMLRVIARERLGDRQGALEAAEANRADLKARLTRFPGDTMSRAYLGVALAQLGREAEALAEAEQAVRLKSHDAFTGPPVLQIYAMMEVILGRRREAIHRLERLLATPYRSAISAAELRLDPVWDPLRNEPAFQDLLRRFEH